MLDIYDKLVKEHIQSFLQVKNKKILVYGLANEDSSDEMTFSRAGDCKDSISLPLVSVFRTPVIQITDDAMTKKPMNYEGYYLLEDSVSAIHLNAMRCTLEYNVDVYAETKKVTEDIATQLYFRLRNNNQIKAVILLPIVNTEQAQMSTACVADIVMEPEMTHLKIQDLNNSQIYKLRISFQLQNVNIYDILERDKYSIKYEITAKINEVDSNL